MLALKNMGCGILASNNYGMWDIGNVSGLWDIGPKK